MAQALTDAKVEHFALESLGTLSKYFDDGGGPSLFIVDLSTGRLTEVAKYTPLYQRYSGAVRLSRLYVDPEHLSRARTVLARLTHPGL